MKSVVFVQRFTRWGFVFLFVTISVIVAQSKSVANEPSYSPPSQTIKTATPVLQCTFEAPTVTYDYDAQHYIPMPIVVTLTVQNTGDQKTDSVFATMSIPNDLMLAGLDAPNKNTKPLYPAKLYPNISGKVKWRLKHPISLTDRVYTISAWVKTNGLDSIYCECQVVIPGASAASIDAACQTPDALTFDTVDSVYKPNPFTVKASAVNLGNGIADSVTAFLYLPEHVVLLPGESLRKSFGTLRQWRLGDPISELTWQVKYIKRLRYDTVLDFKWAVGGVDSASGRPLDTLHMSCKTRVPGLKPSYNSICISVPDSFVLSEDGSKVEPNPFTVTYGVKNTSYQTGSIKWIEIYYNGDDVFLDSSTPKRQVVNKTLKPGEQVLVSWKVHVKNRMYARTIYFECIAIDDENNPMHCRKYVYIPPVEPPKLWEGHHVSQRTITYNAEKQVYDNPFIEVTHTLKNIGGWSIEDVEQEVELRQNAEYFVFDKKRQNVNPVATSILAPGDSTVAAWYFRLVNQNNTGVSQFVELGTRVKAKTLAEHEPGCMLVVELKPTVEKKVIEAGMGEAARTIQYIPRREVFPKPNYSDCRTNSVASFLLMQNTPNPFSLNTTIQYAVPEATYIRLDVLNVLGAVVLTLVDGYREKGFYSVECSANNISKGVYFYRMQAADFIKVMKMVVEN